jgi:outer membrane protein assembly factor BamB
LGFFRIGIDRETLEASIVSQRSGALHLNAVRFLEAPPTLKIKIGNVTLDGTVIGCDVTLTHPFPGLNQYAGFDVHGVLISDGSIFGFADPDIVISGPGGTRLLNADGFTRWWNAVEFPDNGTMFSYRDGKLGVPDKVGHYGATLNGYKAYADGLGAIDDVTRLVDPSLQPYNRRAVYKPGHMNTRRYEIEFADNGSGGPLIVFNYAVDASWEPVSPPPEILPDDYPLVANMPEAFLIEVEETINTLYHADDGENGGALGLDIRVHDWQGALGDSGTVADEVAEVVVESPGLFAGAVSAASEPGSGEGATYSTWRVEIIGSPPSTDDQMLLITVVSANGDWQPGLTGFTGSAPLAAYQLAWASVSSEPPTTSQLHLLAPNGGETWKQGCPYSIEWESSGDPIDYVKLDYSIDGFVSDVNEIVDSTPNDGEYEWTLPEIDSDSVRVRVSAVANPGVFDISDGDFSINAPGPSPWPTFKYDYQNIGRSPYAGPTTNNVIWATPLSDEITPGVTIADDGTLYVGTNCGDFFALDPDGDILWYLNLGMFVLGSASIADDGRVYVGSWNGATGYLYAIECGGDIVWQFDCLGNINQTTPAIGEDGTVYIGNNNGRFWAVNPEGTEKWQFSSGGGFLPSPALGPDGSIYLASAGGHVYGITDNGQGDYSIFWNHDFGDHITCPPAIDGGTVYVTALYSNLLWACDPSTDTILWTGSMGDGAAEVAPTVGTDGRVYMGSYDGKVYAFEPGGSIAWTFPTGAIVTASPILDPNGRLYIGSRDHFIYCLDSDDGSFLWSFETGDIIRPSAAIAPDGTMYLGGHDAVLRAFRDE